MAKMSARCFCGSISLKCTAEPLTVAICHCEDCRRVTGAAVPGFAAFHQSDLISEAGFGKAFESTLGVKRWFCDTCGSLMACWFDYLPEQVYVPVGVIDQAEQLKPALHCYFDKKLPWLEISDDLPKYATSGRDRLNETKPPA